jgi:hypothetical protein
MAKSAVTRRGTVFICLNFTIVEGLLTINYASFETK